MAKSARIPAALIVAFCLWHMAAVALYLLPRKNAGPLHAVQMLTRPYVLLFSQWQKWDIFSPDPLRRVSTYVVERNAGDRWETAAILDFDHLPWWRRAKELKVAGRVESEWKTLAEPYLKSLCDMIPYADGTDLKLTVRSIVVPSDTPSLASMADLKPAVSERTMAVVYCPRS
jgi:hypothetical protein